MLIVLFEVIPSYVYFPEFPKIDILNKPSIDKKEKLEQIAVTVCEVLRDLRKRNGCYRGTPDDGWSWLGSSTVEGEFVIYRGNFYSLSLEPRSSTFSCNESDRFGRYLFFRHLKLEDYSTAFFYIKVPISSTDPCGVGDFVFF